MPSKKIKTLQDLYPTPTKNSGIENRKSENFGFNVLYMAYVLAMPPILITLVLSYYLHRGHETQVDIANNSILFIVAFILVGVLSLLYLLRARTVLKRDTTNFGLLSTLYVLVVLPATLYVANFAVGTSIVISGMHYLIVAVISILVITLVFSLFARITNA